jgi:fluoride exporter
MPGLVPGIHVFRIRLEFKDVDGRDKPGHDEGEDVMAAYMWVAIGSALGGVARHWCSVLAAQLFGLTFPWGTLFVNVLGSFIIGGFFALTEPEGRLDVSADAKLFVMVGLCGGYTTFSSFSLQTLGLIHDEKWLLAIGNVIGSVTFCMLAVWAGHALANAVR